MRLYTREKKKELDELHALAVHAKGFPFSVYEGPEMETIHLKQSPGYTPLNTYALGGPLLESTFEKVKIEIMKIISNSQKIDVIFDESTNVARNRIINLFINTNADPIFIAYYEPPAKKLNAQFFIS
jgi:hypothetical protein